MSATTITTVYLHPGIEGEVQTDDPCAAIERVGRDELGYAAIASIERHEESDTFFVQFYESAQRQAMSRRYVAIVSQRVQEPQA